MIINDILPNVSAWVDEQRLSELYDHATNEKHSSLIADMTKGEPIFQKNFDKITQRGNAGLARQRCGNRAF